MSNEAVVISLISVVIAALALLASGISAATAFRGLRHSRRTSRTQLRARVCFEGMGIEPITGTDGQSQIAFSARWKNAGATPARSVKVLLGGMAFDTPEQALEYQFATDEVDEELSGNIGPGITKDSPTGFFRLTDLRSGSTIVWSKITYKDIFSDEIRHSEVRALLRIHQRADGATTFLWQEVGKSFAT